MAICPGCQTEFNEWASRDKGQPQQYPYKRCYKCKTASTPSQASNKPREASEGVSEPSRADRVVELLEKLVDAVEAQNTYLVQEKQRFFRSQQEQKGTQMGGSEGQG